MQVLILPKNALVKTSLLAEQALPTAHHPRPTLTLFFNPKQDAGFQPGDPLLLLLLFLGVRPGEPSPPEQILHVVASRVGVLHRRFGEDVHGAPGALRAPLPRGFLRLGGLLLAVLVVLRLLLLSLPRHLWKGRVRRARKLEAAAGTRR